MRDRRRFITLFSGGMTLTQRLVALFGKSSIVEIWPMNETSGTVAYGVVNGYNGAYTGVDLANVASRAPGAMAPYFDGTNDFVDNYSSGLNAAFNRDEGTFGILAKRESIVADGVARRLYTITAGTGNYMYSATSISLDGRLDQRWTGQGVIKQTSTTDSITDWALRSTRWSISGDNVKQYVNGSPGAALNTLTPWDTSALISAGFILGAASLTPSGVFKGWLSYAFLLNRAVTDAEALQANQILGG